MDLKKMLILNNIDELNDLGVDKSIIIDDSNTLYVNVLLDKSFNDAKELLLEEIKLSILEGINNVFDSLFTIEIMGKVDDIFNNTDTYLVYGNTSTINRYNLSDINNYKFIINDYMSNNELVLTSPFYNYTINDELISFPYGIDLVDLVPIDMIPCPGFPSACFTEEKILDQQIEISNYIGENLELNIALATELADNIKINPDNGCVCKCKCKRDINIMGNTCTCDNKCTCVKTFTIPIDGMSRGQAKKVIAELISDYNEDIDFTENTMTKHIYDMERIKEIIKKVPYNRDIYLKYEWFPNEKYHELYSAEISITFELNNIKKIKIK